MSGNLPTNQGAIHKFPLGLPITTVQMPVGARVLHVHEQHGKPCLWALVDPLATLTEPRTFTWVGTGHLVETHRAYWGSAHCGQYVWHIFEVPT